MPGDHWRNETDGDTSDLPRASSLLAFHKGDTVEREIDREWFRASVTDCYVEDGECLYELEYADDGNTEAEVPENELRAATNASRRVRFSSPKKEPVSPLERSLSDEPWEEAEPVAVAHTVSHGSGGAFVVNGPDTKIGAGGGAARGVPSPCFLSFTCSFPQVSAASGSCARA